MMNVISSSILTTLLLLLLLNDHNAIVNADCLVEGDMAFMEGQSLGHIGLACINSTSYNATDSICGPGEGFDGVIINVPAVYTCPTNDDVSLSTPYCVQCGLPGIEGSALCLSSPEVPDYCNASGGSSSGGVTTAPTPTTTTTGDEEEILLPETTPSPTTSLALTPVVEGGSTLTLSPTVVCGQDEEGCVDENYRITYCIPTTDGPCPCPDGFTRCPEYTDGSATFGGYCQPVCCDDGPEGTEVGCGDKYGGALYWNTTFCASIDEGCPPDSTNVGGGIVLPAEIPGSCNSQEECSPTIRSQKPADSTMGVDMCECYAASSTAPLDECEGSSQPCATAKCASNACENYDAYCDFGAREENGMGELGECLLRPIEGTTSTTTTTEETSPVPTVVSTSLVGGTFKTLQPTLEGTVVSTSMGGGTFKTMQPTLEGTPPRTSVGIPEEVSSSDGIMATISAVTFLLMTMLAMMLSN